MCRLFSDYGKFCSHPLDSDSDNDGINDGNEYIIGTNPIDHDSDDDGLTDGLELGVTGDIFDEEYNPNSCATKDGNNQLTNCYETWQPDEDDLSTTNPKEADSDSDGIDDGDEDANKNGKLDEGETAADLFDTDEGGRSDFEEIFTDSTDPRNPDDDIGDSDGAVSYTHLTLPTNREV